MNEEGRDYMTAMSGLTPETVRADLEAGMCPFCGAGPFVSPAQHTNLKHGVDRFALRELAGLTWSASICSPDHAAECAERVRHRPPISGSSGRPRKLSPAAKKSAPQRLQAWKETADEDVVADIYRRAVQASAAGRRIERECVCCGTKFFTDRRKLTGKDQPFATKTCSHECRREIRRRTQAQTFTQDHERTTK